MAEFSCRIGTPAGEIIERRYTAENESALRRELERKDLLVISLRRSGGAMDAARSIMPFRHRVKSKEFLLFNQEFMALIRAGLPIIGSLDILIERRKNPVFKRALSRHPGANQVRRVAQPGVRRPGPLPEDFLLLARLRRALRGRSPPC